MSANLKVANPEPADFGGLEVSDNPGVANLTSFGRGSSNYISEQLKAITERRAGRINAAAISQQEEIDLQNQRRALVEKQYSGGLTPAEERRLAMVRWSLDRIDDARSGEILDALEGAIVRYEAAREEIRNLVEQIDRLFPQRGR